ncbi:MAG TPA: hypothetical protein VFY22_02610, partial [Hydrogenophaga sp.]|nr:hypothetical protein [Hydrogenophaga sp.]
MTTMRPLDLANFPQPESNDSGSVEAALDALHNAGDESTANEAYDAFLWAVGNNHAGTFYPVILGVLPEIELILMNGKAWAQRAVMEALIDLGGSFVPEDGYETYLGASVQQALNESIHSMRHHVAALVNGNDARAKSAIDLLELIDDQADFVAAD